ncbi:MAG: HAMP domain-containing histidine kinase [Spirochaetaceae bacterium]|nr:HAMP domain-containing histidine kinase [Spirochaetaceae bacterium]
MIKILQTRFIMIAMLSMTIVIGFLALVINLGIYYSSNTELNKMADFLLENNGSFPDKFYLQGPKSLGFDVSIESRYETRYFTTLVSDTGSIINLNLDNIVEISANEAASYINEVLKDNKKYGFISHYKYAVKNINNTKLIIFINSYQILSTLNNLRNMTLLIGLISLLILFILVILLSNKAIQPYIDNIERQRQFIADAGHEIKTPLSVISADVEVLEMTNGESDWTQSIKGQVIRLDNLIKQLLSLAKMDGISRADENTSKINYSELTKKLCNDFKGLASSKGTVIEGAINENIYILGKHDKIEQLLSLLLENSTKYTTKNTPIIVSLKSNKKNSILKISNQCIGLEKNNLDNLFERFYRGDISHNNSIEGYGIGLSVAKAIVQAHNGKISAYLNDNDTIITFEVRFPLY